MFGNIRLFKSRLLAGLFLFALVGAANALPTLYQEGKEYKKLAPEAQLRVTKGTAPEIAEVFWYGCPHCFAAEPTVQNWLKTKPKDVQFVRVPATFAPPWQFHAKMFYAAQVLGVSDRLHPVLFHAIHVNKNLLESEAKVRAIFIANGVSGEAFDEAFKSFDVGNRVRRADTLVKGWQLMSVPSFIVNGKYVVTVQTAGGHENLFKVVDFLTRLDRPVASTKSKTTLTAKK